MLYPSASKGLAILAYFPGTVKDIPCESPGDPDAVSCDGQNGTLKAGDSVKF